MSAAFVLPLLQARAEFVPVLRRIEAQRQAEPEATAVPQAPTRPAPRPQLAFYRKYTEALLRRYMRMSMELGRIPSLLGRGEMFRAKVSNYRMESFEDVVIFCHDVERCIQSLTAIQQSAIDLVAIKEYTIQEAAPMLGMCREIAVRHYTRAIDRLTDMFIETEILNPARGRKCCQAPQPVQNAPS